MKELMLEKDDRFNYMRMDHETYLELINQVSPFIEKKDTRLREARNLRIASSVLILFLKLNCVLDKIFLFSMQELSLLHISFSKIFDSA